MKRFIFICMLMSALLCSASQQQKGYILTGKVKGAHNGDTVKLCYFDDWNVVVMQQTLVKNGKYELVGRQDTAVFRYVTCSANGASLGSVQFVLENEKLNVDLDSTTFNYNIKGSAVNEAWCAFHNEDERLCGESMNLFHEASDESLSPETRETKKLEQQIKDKEIADYRLQFCKQNIGNIAGAYCLAMFYKDFDPKVVANLVTKIPSTCTMKEVVALKEVFENKQKTAEGATFTDFSMKTPDGKVMSVNDVAKKNKVTMIDFWASWCGPCRAEMPAVKAAYKKFHSKGFEIVGVSLDNDAEAWKKAITDLQLVWPQMSDLKGWKCEGAALYGVRAIPATIFVQDGKIIARDLRGEDIETKLAELLN